ncbi:bacteriocin-like protein [Chryseobacterium shigense]
MKNLKKVSRDHLKTIKGGLSYCNEQRYCNIKFCCADGVCRPIDSAYCQ